MTMNNATRKELDALFNFCMGLVIKDEREAEESESLDSSRNAYEYMAAYSGTDDKTELERQVIIQGYTELNSYYDRLWGPDKEGVSPYLARSSEDMEILGYPQTVITKERYSYFLQEYAKCRRMFRSTVQTQAFEHHKHYQAFCRLCVILMAMQRYLAGSIDNANNVDFFEEHQLRNMFASMGLGIYGSMPLKYQRVILKNINTLMRLKGTTQVIVNIVRLFGFDSIEVYKHFLVKDLVRGSDGEVIFPSPDNPTVPESLRFIKVRHDADDLEEEFRLAQGATEDYDKFIAEDPYWQSNKDEILAHEFNRIATKYVSIDSTMNLLRKTYELVYFRSMLSRAHLDGPVGTKLEFSNLRASSQMISLYDGLLACQILVTKSLGYEDDVVRDPSSIAYIYGYSFDNLGPMPMSTQMGILNNVKDPASETVGINIDKFVELYRKNDSYREAFKTAIKSTQDYEEYKTLRQVFDVRFFTEAQIDHFDGYVTYSDYLRDVNPTLVEFIDQAVADTTPNSDGETANPSAIVDALLELTVAIENYVGNGDGDISPLVALDSYLVDYVKNYIKQLVDIFKSYTTEIRQFTIKYILGDDPFTNSIHWRWKAFRFSELAACGILEVSDDVYMYALKRTADGINMTDRTPITVQREEVENLNIQDEDIRSVDIASFEAIPLGDTVLAYTSMRKADGLVSMQDTFTLTVIP
jgi:hypothetical protein